MIFPGLFFLVGGGLAGTADIGLFGYNLGDLRTRMARLEIWKKKGLRSITRLLPQRESDEAGHLRG